MNIKKIIITLTLILAIIHVGCGRDKSNPPPIGENREPAYISDRFGFKIYDLDGYKEDTSAVIRARTLLTLRKDDIRVQFGFIKGARMMPVEGQSDTADERQMLLDWTTGMLETPQFFPGTEKILLKWEYAKLSGNTCIVTEVLLQSTLDEKSPLTEKTLKFHKEDMEFFNNHKRALLRTYHVYRGKDLFNIEFLADPLAFQAEISNFEKTIIAGFVFMEKSQ